MIGGLQRQLTTNISTTRSADPIHLVLRWTPRARHERDPENRSDPGRGRGRLQPAGRGGRGRTLARLRALRSDLIDPTIAVHHGRIVKRTGDGSLIEFRSVVDAVRCAIEVQTGMIERNAGVPPSDASSFASASTLATWSRRATAI